MGHVTVINLSLHFFYFKPMTAQKNIFRHQHNHAGIEATATALV